MQVLLYQELSILSMHNPIAAVNNEGFAFLICLTSGLDHICAQNSKYVVMQHAAMVAVFYVDVMQSVTLLVKECTFCSAELIYIFAFITLFILSLVTVCGTVTVPDHKERCCH